MRCHSFSLVYKPIVSLVTQGYFLFLTGLLGCNTSPKKADPLIAKQVPSIYHSIHDTDLHHHQDTMYLGNRYYSGFCYELNSSGDTISLAGYFNGVEEGLQKKWFAKNKPREERFYINGKKEGIQRGWWPDGKPRFYFEAANNEYNGVFREWYASGLLGKEFHYTNGQETGSQRLWWDNGTVRANYVIRDGRQYGLIGLKTCTNPYDSINRN